ncbi:MAG: hypothetical protein ACLFU8_09655 [Anaerolineales bacterium]
MKEVSVLGVLHNLHASLFAESYSLEDLAAILRAVRPQCVLAELPPDWEARYTARTLPDFKMEYREVILPLAEEVGYTVVPVDYASPLYAEAGAHWDEARQTLVPYGEVKHALLSQFEDAVYTALPQAFRSPQALNSPACNDLIRALKETEALWFFRQHPEHNVWEQHNRVNYEHILEVVSRREEERFLVTFGLYHKYWFEERLQQERWLRFEPMEAQLAGVRG